MKSKAQLLFEEIKEAKTKRKGLEQELKNKITTIGEKTVSLSKNGKYIYLSYEQALEMAHWLIDMLEPKEEANWFRCTTHNCSHQRTFCGVINNHNCTSVGPFSTKEEADNFGVVEVGHKIVNVTQEKTVARHCNQPHP